VNTANRKVFVNCQTHQLCLPLICLLALISYAAADDTPVVPSIRYRIDIDLDYSGAKYKGRETVRYTNSTREELESLIFQLYPNIGLSDEDEPSLNVQRVIYESRELRFSLRSRNTAIKVDLPYRLAPGKSIDLTLDFAARIPRMQREEASLLAHFLHEVNDAVSDERQQRDARDIFFAGEEAMLLGYFYPVLTVREMQATDPSLVSGVNGITFSEIADYDVNVKTADGVTVIGSGMKFGPMSAETRRKTVTYNFRGQRLRGFALALAERVKSVEQKVGNVRVVSYFREGDERLGRRALNIATLAVEAYSKAFGDYAFPILQVIELPLPAGYSGIEFPGLVGLAQAYYIDFDDPKAARLPSVLREQADVIKSSFEFTLAHGIANQWWGEIVGNDSERTPYVGEALASFAAAYYHEVAYGKQLGELIIEQQLRGAYQAYRMLGGVDQEVDKPAKEFKSSLQFTAIVQAKGGLLFVALRNELGDEKFFDALRYYFTSNSFRTATPDQLRYPFLAALTDSRGVRTLFQRWLKEKHGDEDIGTSDLTLLPQPVSKMRTLGRVFIKIGRTAARPF
jgi:Peptidase family M1 domain